MGQRLFVGNVSHSITDAALNDFVVGAGFHVASVVVIRDKMTGQSRGFGFIELADGEDSSRVIAGLNGKDLDGRTLTVNEARPMRAEGGGGSRGGGSGNRGGRSDRGPRT